MKKMSSFAIGLLSLTLTGCQWFNDVGEHFPVIGERCENWQCFTQAGQQQSELNKQARLRQLSAAPPATQPAPPSAPPAAPPYPMTPEQLKTLPPPAIPQ